MLLHDGHQGCLAECGVGIVPDCGSGPDQARRDAEGSDPDWRSSSICSMGPLLVKGPFHPTLGTHGLG